MTRLKVDRLRISKGPSELVRDVSLSVGPGETVSVLGSSGSGKTLTALAIMGLLPPGLSITGGEIEYEGLSLRGLSSRAFAELRGKRISAVLQEPSLLLRPWATVEAQLARAQDLHGARGARVAEGERPPKTEREQRATWLTRLGITDPERVLRAFPHELSGGMKQRVVLSIALINRPELVILDEPSSALDRPTSELLLEVLAEERETHNLSTVIISHDATVLGRGIGRVVVMLGGFAVESGPAAEVLSRPRHPYTALLIEAAKLARGGPRLPMREPLETTRGCPFRNQCRARIDACAESVELRDEGPRTVRCWVPLES